MLAERYGFEPAVVAKMPLKQILLMLESNEEGETDPHKGTGKEMTPDQVMNIVQRRRMELAAGKNLRD